MDPSQPFSDLKAIYQAAIKRVDPYAMARSRVTLDNNTLDKKPLNFCWLAGPALTKLTDRHRPSQ
ncbi:MAG: hypothetical protein KBG98_10420 [Desulfobacter sp.]|uniref:hypothetical protein n=1 Tax=Desulfobacter sp. TaxID=2294 RepID=UPI001B6DBE53|nr:hypothetical protein [Desulfobacter sp.]MBP8830051.1 hypothetical protein [Desulfobacter sp.]